VSGKYFVISGTKDQFNYFIRKKTSDMWNGGADITMSHFIYVDNKDRFRGIQNPSGWFYGTWYERPDIRDILAWLTAACIDDGSKLQAIDKLYDKLVEMGK